MATRPKYTGPKRPEIQTLLENYRNLYPSLDDETFERLTRGVLANDGLTVKVVLSARGNLLDGYHRLLILHNDNRKQLTEDDYTIDYTAVDELSEMKAHVSYQETRRQSTSADQAAMARTVMRRFGWSAGMFAEEFGFNPNTVKKWLQRNPDPAFDAEMAERGREGKDGKTYTDPPKAKRGTTNDSPGTAVRKYTNKHLAELTDPEVAMWISEHIDDGDREEVSMSWERIATAASGIAGAVAPVAPVSDVPFERQSPAAVTTEVVVPPTKKAMKEERLLIESQMEPLGELIANLAAAYNGGTPLTADGLTEVSSAINEMVDMSKRILMLTWLEEIPSTVLKGLQ